MVLLGEIGQDRLKMARLRHCGSSGGKVVLEIRQERQETNWKLEGGAFCTSRLQGEKLHLVAIFLGGAGADGPAPGKREAILGKFQSMAARDASEQGCILNKKIHTVDARKEETFNMNGMTTAKT